MTEERDTRVQVQAATEQDLEVNDLELKDLESKNDDAANVQGGACATGKHIPETVIATR
jgi:hypothetical protein